MIFESKNPWDATRVSLPLTRDESDKLVKAHNKSFDILNAPKIIAESDLDCSSNQFYSNAYTGKIL